MLFILHCKKNLLCYSGCMALTKKDKKFIMETISDAISVSANSQLALIRLEMKAMERSLWAGINGLKIYMETRFKEVDNRFNLVDQRFDRIEKIIEKSSRILDNHEQRIMILEDKTSTSK